MTAIRRLAALLALAIAVAACTGIGATAPPPSAAPTATASSSPTAVSTPSAPPSPTTAPSPTPVPVELRWATLDAGPGPTPREDHTLTVDEAGTSAYLFGGRDGGQLFDDLWRFDLATDRWERLAPAGGPSARFGHTATWVPGIGLAIWSGQAGTRFFNDLWTYQPAADRWQRRPAGGSVPAARYGACAGLDPDGRLWISHGFTDSGRFADTRAYDFGSGRWRNATPEGQVPVERCLHDCLFASDGRLVLYAGQTTGVQALGDLWALAPAGAWSRARPSPAPAARQLYALAGVGDRAFVFGGGGEDGGKLADLWRLDLAELTWSELRAAGEGPIGRSGATLVADPARSRLLLFGGRTRNAALGDLWHIPLPG